MSGPATAIAYRRLLSRERGDLIIGAKILVDSAVVLRNSRGDLVETILHEFLYVAGRAHPDPSRFPYTVMNYRAPLRPTRTCTRSMWRLLEGIISMVEQGGDAIEYIFAQAHRQFDAAIESDRGDGQRMTRDRQFVPDGQQESLGFWFVFQYSQDSVAE